MVACQRDSYEQYAKATNGTLSSGYRGNETSSLQFSATEIFSPIAIAEAAEILLLFLPMLVTLCLRTHWTAIKNRQHQIYTKLAPSKWSTETVVAWLEFHMQLPDSAQKALEQKVDGIRIMHIADDQEFDETFNVTNRVFRKKIRLGVLMLEESWTGGYLNWMKRWTDASLTMRGMGYMYLPLL